MLNLESLSTSELLAEKSYYEQLGTAGEVQLLEIIEEIQRRFNNQKKITKEPVQTEINVYFEEGYRWSVNIDNNESIETGITKAEAITLARKLKKEYPNSIINEQKLNRSQRKQNISWLHENSYVYDKM